MERVLNGNMEYIVGYHTQEYRGESSWLKAPLQCDHKNAWLGIGYYFWTEIDFAEYWGQDSKSGQTGYYDIYTAHLNCEKCINTVFDEAGYYFFRDSIEETIEFMKDSGVTISLEQINRFLAERIWVRLGIEGIIYDDKPRNPRNPERKYSLIPPLYYKKRIQIVIFDMKNIHGFKLLSSKLSRTK